LKSGAKTVPEGGYWSMPRPYGDGFLIIGDGASLLNISRLKGVHTAIKSGILAAETIAEALEKDDTSAATLAGYRSRFDASWLKEELYRVRNFRQAFSKTFFLGAMHAGLLYLFGGRLFKDPIGVHEDYRTMEKWTGTERTAPRFDGALTFDKVTGVYHAGSIHEENQPSHLLVRDTTICVDRCAKEYGNPCERFCPAAVYEIVKEQGTGSQRLQINHSNCVHCKTCDVIDPYGIITWTVPSDAGGPKYDGL
jgi:electron-transferring-flavoprotein dehydrogenase